jgi:hypothetical protein
MATAATANLLVGGLGKGTAGISHRRRHHPREAPKALFRTPETATAKQHLPLARSGWRINWGTQDRMAAFLGSLAIQGTLA